MLHSAMLFTFVREVDITLKLQLNLTSHVCTWALHHHLLEHIKWQPSCEILLNPFYTQHFLIGHAWERRPCIFEDQPLFLEMPLDDDCCCMHVQLVYPSVKVLEIHLCNCITQEEPLITTLCTSYIPNLFFPKWVLTVRWLLYGMICF